MSRFQLRQKGLTIIFIGLVAILAFNGWILSSNIYQVRHYQGEVDHVNSFINALELLMSSVNNAEAGQRGYLLTGNIEHLERYKEGVNNAWTYFNEARRLSQLHVRNFENVGKLEELLDRRFGFLDVNIREVNKYGLLNSDKIDAVIAGGQDAMEALRRQINLLKTSERLDLKKQSLEVRNAFQFVDILLVLVTVVNLTLAFAVFVLFRYRLLGQDRENQTKAKEAWIKSGEIDAAALFSGEYNLKSYMNRILNFIGESISSIGANLYLYSDGHLTLEAGYGLSVYGDAKLNLPARPHAMLSEFLQRQGMTEVDDVPKDHFRIHSGFGESLPKHLLFVPLRFQGRAVALLEIASFTSLSTAHREWLQRVGTVVAAGLGAAISQKALQGLLEETRSQAEDLQDKQKQLNQKNRDLESSKLDIEKKAAELERVSQYKSEFLANISHEIRTPLSAVLGFADILSDKGLSEEEREDSLAAIGRNGQLLLRIIDDILDLSRIEARKLEFEFLPIDLKELLTDVQRTLLPKAQEKGVSLEFTFGEGFTDRLISDPLRLKQIMLNLVNNAIKFTQKGSVKVVAEGRPRESAAQRDFIFTITDTGVGLSKEERARIFQPFVQADGSTKRKFGGSGLGLVISRQLARQLGGDVVLKESQSGKGSTFVASICAEVPDPSQLQSRHSPKKQREPATRVEKRAVRRKKSMEETTAVGAVAANGGFGASLTGKRILVVDDVLDNRLLIERYLRPIGVDVQLAGGGQEAIDRVRQAEMDAVLMDIQMPSMDGYETTSELRHMGYQKPIIALTAHAMREELDRCYTAGCDKTLTKPVSRRVLVDALSEALH